MPGLIAPKSTAEDARQRALRTFVVGLLVDVGSAVVALAVTQLGSVEWTRTYWIALGAMVAKTAIGTMASYVARHVAPPS